MTASRNSSPSYVTPTIFIVPKIILKTKYFCFLFNPGTKVEEQWYPTLMKDKFNLKFSVQLTKTSIVKKNLSIVLLSYLLSLIRVLIVFILFIGLRIG